MRAIIVCVVVLLLFALLWRNNSRAERALVGLWRGSEEFCRDADLDGFLVAIGPRCGWLSPERRVYVIMQSGDMIVFDALLRTKWYGLSFGCGGRYYFQILNQGETAENGIPISDSLPQNLSVSVDFLTGRMIWTNGDTVYADMFRDNEASQHFS